MDQRMIQSMSQLNNIKTIQTSKLRMGLDCKVAHSTSFQTICESFTNFVGDRHTFFVFKFIHVNNNSKMYLDASITEIKQYVSQKCEAS